MIIAVVNRKGGVGKTTIAANLAYRLRGGEENPNKVLLVDLDSQANATSLLGVTIKKKTLTINDVLSAIARGSESDLTKEDILGVITPVSEPWNIDLMPSEAALADRNTDVGIGREKRLSHALGAIQSEYDYIVIDCPPSLDFLTINALCAADRVVIVSMPRAASSDGTADVIDSIYQTHQNYNPNLQLEGILVNSYRADRVDRRNWYDSMKATYGQLIFERTIPEREHIAAAATEALPVLEGADEDFDAAMNMLCERFFNTDNNDEEK